MTTMEVQVLLSSSSLSSTNDEGIATTPSWNTSTNNQQHNNYDTTSTKSIPFKEQHPLRMINDNEDEEEGGRNLDHHENDLATTTTATQMHLSTNIKHLKLRDDYLNNIIQEDSSITFHNIMSNPNKIITLTDDTIGNSITICDGSSSSSTSKNTTTTKTTASTTTTTSSTTSTTTMRGCSTRNQKKSPVLSKNMDSMPYPMIPVPSIVMSKSESYDALFTSSSSSSSSASATTAGEVTAEGASATTSKVESLPVSGHLSSTDDNETEWYPDSPTTVATDVQTLSSPNDPKSATSSSSTPKCMPEMITTSKEKTMVKDNSSSTTTTTTTSPERSEFLKSQHQLEKKTNFKECFKLFFKGKRGELISPLNDLSIYDGVKEEANVVTMVVEISKGTKAKMFCDVSQAYHPIVQDVCTQTGKLSYMDSPFHWNLGFIPQTLTSASSRSQQQRPLSVIEISSGTKLPLGSVTKVKVLGALGILQSSENEEIVDWKILCIRSNDSSFAKYNDKSDVPNYIQCGIREWFRWNTTSSSSEQIQFANNENYQSKNFAIQLIQNAHITWKKNLTFLK